MQALVEGGGASGRMSLSLELPAMIDSKTRAKFVKASSEEETARVYAKLSGTDYYSIRGDVSNTTAKNLWDKAVKASLLASQIVLNADQINLAGKTIFTSQKTANLASTAQSNAENTAKNQRNEMAQKLGYNSYDDMVNKATQGQTIIDGGYLRTALIDVERLIAKKLHIDTDKNSNQDFEAWFDGINGLKIKNNAEEIFSVQPNGTTVFSGEIKCAGFQVLNEKYI